MKESEILKMVEDVLPEHISVRDCRGIHKMNLGLNDDEYGIVELSLMVCLDTPACDKGDDVDRKRFKTMKGALEVIHTWATTLEMSGIADLAERGLHGKNRTSDMPRGG